MEEAGRQEATTRHGHGHSYRPDFGLSMPRKILCVVALLVATPLHSTPARLGPACCPSSDAKLKPDRGRPRT